MRNELRRGAAILALGLGILGICLGAGTQSEDAARVFITHHRAPLFLSVAARHGPHSGSRLPCSHLTRIWRASISD